jgi:hypothetical protein
VTYARFGPAQQSAGGGWGLDEPRQADVTDLNVTVQFGSDGLPTPDSYKALETALLGAEPKATPGTVRLNYFKTSDAETAALQEWMKQQHDAAANTNFARAIALISQSKGCWLATRLTNLLASKLSNHPNTLFGELVPLANDSSHHFKATAHIVPDSVRKLDQQ